MRRAATLGARSIERPDAGISIDGSFHFLGRWNTAELAALARDRAILYFGATHLKLKYPRRARRLGPASPEELRRLARIAYKRETATSRYHGVSWNEQRRRWDAHVRHGGRRLSAGSFTTEKEAALAVDRLSRHLGHTYLNFPEVALAPASVAELKARAHRLRTQQTSSRYIGPVYTDALERPWFFYILAGGLHTAVGGYATDREAALAYDRATLHYHPDPPSLNFPEEARALGAADLDTLRREAHDERKKSMTSRYRGVCFCAARGRWVATIYVGKSYNLGYFDVEEDAARAYDDAAIRLRGPDYRLNFPLTTPHRR